MNEVSFSEHASTTGVYPNSSLKTKILDEGEGYKISMVELMPGKTLSCPEKLPVHRRWTVIKGAGRARVHERDIILHTGETLNVPPGEAHNLTNPCLEKLLILEIQREQP